METAEKVAIVKAAIGSYQDFPKPGILFKDVFGVFNDVAATQALLDLSVAFTKSLEIDAIVGLDARGFLLGPLLAVRLEKPFLPIRKKGKLPGRVATRSFKLEYGEDTLEIQDNDLCKDKRVLVVDDLLATGGTLEAAIQLLKTVRAKEVRCLVIIELESLNGREKLSAPVHSIVQFQ